MGHVLSKNGVGATQSKVEAVQNTRQPNNAKEVRSFLGLVNYCGRFIPNLATIAEPLRRLTRSTCTWSWGKEQEAAFKALKVALASSQTMAYYSQEADTQVIVDASPVGLGAILTQAQADGAYKPVYYASRALTDVERRYSQTEREALAIVWACEKFHVFLYGREFSMIIDHRPLEVIYSPKSKLAARIERWALRLQPYKFKVIYKPGPQNAADSLSHLTVNPPPVAASDDEHIYFVAKHAVPKAFTPCELEEIAAADETQCGLRKCIQQSCWSVCCPDYTHIKDELSCIGHLILRGSRIVIPQAARYCTLLLAHEGHQGIVKTKQRLRTKVWWPGIDKDSEQHVRSCAACQINWASPRPFPVTRTELPQKPWQIVAIDACGPFPSGEHLLVITDYYSRWVEVSVLHRITASNIVKCLTRIFATHGLPETIVSDNATQFTGTEFKEFLALNAIQHRRITPYWPQANGEIERQNRTLCQAIRAAHSEGKDWHKEMYTFLLAYRSTPHSVTGCSPAELLFSRQLRTKLPEVSSVGSSTVGGAAVRQRDFECYM